MKYEIKYRLAPEVRETVARTIEADSLIDATVQARNYLSLRYPNHELLSVAEERVARMRVTVQG